MERPQVVGGVDDEGNFVPLRLDTEGVLKVSGGSNTDTASEELKINAILGDKEEETASSDTGPFSIIQFFKRLLLQYVSKIPFINNKIPNNLTVENNRLLVNTGSSDLGLVNIEEALGTKNSRVDSLVNLRGEQNIVSLIKEIARATNPLSLTYSLGQTQNISFSSGETESSGAGFLTNQANQLTTPANGIGFIRLTYFDVVLTSVNWRFITRINAKPINKTGQQIKIGVRTANNSHLYYLLFKVNGTFAETNSLSFIASTFPLNPTFNANILNNIIVTVEKKAEKIIISAMSTVDYIECAYEFGFLHSNEDEQIFYPFIEIVNDSNSVSASNLNISELAFNSNRILETELGLARESTLQLLENIVDLKKQTLTAWDWAYGAGTNILSYQSLSITLNSNIQNEFRTIRTILNYENLDNIIDINCNNSLDNRSIKIFVNKSEPTEFTINSFVISISRNAGLRLRAVDTQFSTPFVFRSNNTDISSYDLSSLSSYRLKLRIVKQNKYLIFYILDNNYQIVDASIPINIGIESVNLRIEVYNDFGVSGSNIYTLTFENFNNTIGSIYDPVALNDTGNFSLVSLLKRLMFVWLNNINNAVGNTRQEIGQMTNLPAPNDFGNYPIADFIKRISTHLNNIKNSVASVNLVPKVILLNLVLTDTTYFIVCTFCKNYTFKIRAGGDVKYAFMAGEIEAGRYYSLKSTNEEYEKFEGNYFSGNIYFMGVANTEIEIKTWSLV